MKAGGDAAARGGPSSSPLSSRRPKRARSWRLSCEAPVQKQPSLFLTSWGLAAMAARIASSSVASCWTDGHEATMSSSSSAAEPSMNNASSSLANAVRALSVA
eukprot:Amastigsp_a509240_7.p5 type:complete len:103 gc:universal Amastigsp_a509240_7:1603-1295(-)